MPRTEYSTVIPAAAERVWRVVRDYGGLADWQPAVTRCVLDREHGTGEVGAVRHLTMDDGATVVETLVGLDDRRRLLEYAIVDSPYPVDDYAATIQVLPITDVGHALVVWTLVFDCEPALADDLARSFRDGIFARGLHSLARRFQEQPEPV